MGVTVEHYEKAMYKMYKDISKGAMSKWFDDTFLSTFSVFFHGSVSQFDIHKEA